MTATPEHAQLQQAARQAWAGLWHSCMRDAGGCSVLPYDPAPVADVLKMPAPPPAPTPRARVAATAAAIVPGQFYFRDTILDQLDEYMIYLKRMKRADPQAYALYSKIGAGVMPVRGAINRIEDRKFVADRQLSPWFLQTLPTFGAIACAVSPFIEADEDKDERYIYPRFFWFTKYERNRQSPQVEWTNLGTCYSCTVYWDKKSFPKLKQGSPQEFPVAIDPQGGVHVLRTLNNSCQVIRHKHGRYRGHTSAVPQQRWGISSEFLRWAKSHDAPPQQFLAQQFIYAANSFEAVNSSMIRIEARKEGITATFAVDVLRTPYFFTDRDETVTEAGTKQRIFHAVRTHVRKNGSAVRMHFRGLRRFRWNGYEVRILVPGREHLDVTEVNFGTIDEHWAAETGASVEVHELSGRLAAALAAPPGDWAGQRKALSDPAVH